MRRIGYSNMNNNKKRGIEGNEYLILKHLAKEYLINNYEFYEKEQEDNKK